MFMLVQVCTRLCLGPPLTGFQVPLLQHRQPLGPGTKDGDAGGKIDRGKKKKTEIRFLSILIWTDQ